jgi:signal recognition particle subunit SRP54
MTPAERNDTKILNGSRRARSARGSGMTVTDVNSLVNRFEQAAKMMKTMQKGGMPAGMPGMPAGMQGMGFGGGGSKNKGKDKKKTSKSGNPAKRAAEEAARLNGQKPGADSGNGSAFGL